VDYSFIHINEVRDDLGETGSDSTWLDFVKAATLAVEVEMRGSFVPFTETRRFDGPGGKMLITPDLLSSAPTIISDSTTLTTADYLLYPRQRRWANGPFERIEIDPDATGLTAWGTDRNDISVAGKWGWLDETEAISGATVQNATSQDATTTTLTVETGKIRVGHLVLIESELEFVTAVTIGATDTCTVVRGVLGTTAAVHLNGVAIRRQVVPPLIHWITKSVAASLWKRAKSGYTGKTVVPELGQINLFDVLPKELLKSAKMQYHLQVSV